MELTIKGRPDEIRDLLAGFAPARDEDVTVAVTQEDIDQIVQRVKGRTARIDNPEAPVDAIRPGNGHLQAERPRVLTYDEVWMLPEAERVWVEHSTAMLADQWATRSGIKLYFDAGQWCWLGDCVSRFARAWSSRPTPYQSAAVPWPEL